MRMNGAAVTHPLPVDNTSTAMVNTSMDNEKKAMEVKKGPSALPAENPERGPLASSPPTYAWLL